MKKALLLLVLAPLAAAFLAGCPHRVEPGAPAGGEQGKVELVLYTWTEVPEFTANQELLAKFQAQHPNITVRLQNESGSQQAMAKLQTMMASKTAPDVMSLHGAFYYPFAAKGVLMDLEPLAKADAAFNLDDFYPGLVKQCRWQGKLMSLPRYTSVYSLFYNKALFDAAGLKYPGADGEWTWDKYLEAAKKLTKPGSGGSGEQWGCFVDFWGSRMYPWIWSNDGDIMDADRQKCTADDPATIEAISFVSDLRLKHQVCPASSATQRNQGLDQFSQGNVGMYITGPWDIQTLKKTPTLKWDVAPTPKKKRFATLLGTENYAISADTKHPKEAFELFKFLLSAESQNFMQEKLEKMPSRKSICEGPYLAGSQKAGYDRKVFVDALQYAQQAPNIPEWDEVSHFIQDQLDLIWSGKKPAAEGCKAAAAQVNKRLQEIRSKTTK
jgi:multiple sugar transport system substrate-binding protein